MSNRQYPVPYATTPGGSGGTPAGSTGDIQYNNGGSFGGSTATITSAGALAIPAGGSITISDTANNADLVVQNTTVATSGTTNASPLLELAANYWTGAASAQDLWTIGSSLVAGTNGASTLTFTHTGSTGLATISVPAITILGTTSGSNILSAIGNGTALNTTAATFKFAAAGTVSSGSTTLTLTAASNVVVNVGSGSFASFSGTALGFKIVPDSSLVMFGSASDVGISRLGSASLAIGNGTAGDATGTLKCGQIALNGATAEGAGTMNCATYYASGTVGVTQTAEAVGTLATIGGIVTTFTAVSDERLKIAAPYEGGLSEILQITPIRYRWNEKGQELSGQGGDRDYVGFSAQNTQKAIPETIQSVTKDGFLSFDDRPVISAAVNAIKELHSIIQDLKAEIAELKNKQ